MVTAAGAGSTTATVDTAASGTEIQWTQTGGGTVIQWISGRAPSGGFTLTTSDISIWAHEDNAAANAGGRYRLFKRAFIGGIETELLGGPFDDGVEFTKTTPTEMTWTGNPTDTVFLEDDRILLKLYITNVGTMGGGRSCILTYNAADAAEGDSFLNIAETVSFKSESVTVSAGVKALSTVTFDAATNIETAFTADAASLSTATQAASLNVETAFAADAGSISTVTFDATVTGEAPPTEVSADSASLTLTPLDATVKTDTSFTASAGSMTLAPFEAGVKTDTSIAANSVAMSFSSQAAAVKTDISFTSESESLATETFPAGVSSEVSFTADSATLAMNAFGATVNVGGNIEVLAEAVSLTTTPLAAAVKTSTSFTAVSESLGISPFPATVDVAVQQDTDVQAGLAPLSLVAYSASIGLALRSSHPKQFVEFEPRRRQYGPSVF